MSRRSLLERRWWVVGLMSLTLLGGAPAGTTKARTPAAPAGGTTLDRSNPLKPPVQGSIPVAILLSEGAQVIDFAGPWEVFQDTYIPGRMDPPFQLYTVAESTKPIHTSGGMT